MKINQGSTQCVEKLAKKVENQLMNYQSERHCTLSGRFLGMGSAVTYLWRQDLWAFAAASEVNELSVPSVRSRPWNFAKRLITENLSRSWHSTLRFETDALFSNLHHQWENNKTSACISETYMFIIRNIKLRMMPEKKDGVVKQTLIMPVQNRH